jgi:hypothetical protein
MKKTPQQVVPVRASAAPPPSALGRPLPRWLTRTLAALLVLGLLVLLPNIPILYVYQRYLGQDGPQVQLRLQELRGGMDEKAVLAHFPSSGMRCAPEADKSMGDRVCWAAVGRADGIPALTVALFLRGDRLRLALVQVPWWAHGRLHERLERQWGRPTLEGSGRTEWRLPDGARLEVNTFRSINPLRWSLLMWTAPQGG